jgi:hypothetical protein
LYNTRSDIIHTWKHSVPVSLTLSPTFASNSNQASSQRRSTGDDHHFLNFPSKCKSSFPLVLAFPSLIAAAAVRQIAFRCEVGDRENWLELKHLLELICASAQYTPRHTATSDRLHCCMWN